jgi:hypothetical protein
LGAAIGYPVALALSLAFQPFPAAFCSALKPSLLLVIDLVLFMRNWKSRREWIVSRNVRVSYWLLHRQKQGRRLACSGGKYCRRCNSTDLFDGRNAVVKVTNNALQLADHIVKGCNGACEQMVNYSWVQKSISRIATGKPCARAMHVNEQNEAKMGTSKLIRRNCVGGAVVEVVDAKCFGLRQRAETSQKKRLWTDSIVGQYAAMKGGFDSVWHQG